MKTTASPSWPPATALALTGAQGAAAAVSELQFLAAGDVTAAFSEIPVLAEVVITAARNGFAFKAAGGVGGYTGAEWPR